MGTMRLDDLLSSLGAPRETGALAKPAGPFQVQPDGPRDARLMIVGEAPGTSEVREGKPFVGASGQELSKMLHEAGILRTECFITNVARVQPPRNDISKLFVKNTPKVRIAGPDLLAGMEELQKEISLIKPEVVIALGDTALWALVGERGIGKWRGSVLWAEVAGHRFKLIPTYHPAAILRMWAWRFIAVCDLRRARRELDNPGDNEPKWNFLVRPTFSEVMDTISMLLSRANALPEDEFLRLAGDIETRNRQISCNGIAWSKTDALCIPFMCVERRTGYWSHMEEYEIILRLKELFRHPRVKFAYQNGIYDYQYYAKQWGFVPHLWRDIMFSHHVIFPGFGGKKARGKSLDIQASIYCDWYQYWKDERHDDWNLVNEENYWRYNCKDCCYTFEIAEQLEQLVVAFDLVEQDRFLHDLFRPVLRTTIRGVNCDQKYKAKLAWELAAVAEELRTYLDTAIGYSIFGPKAVSPKKCAQLFYDELGMPVVKDKKTGKPTTADDALREWEKKRPWITPITQRISAVRSVGIYSSTFVGMKLYNGRINCSYNVAGTETFRFSSSSSAFDTGTNLQNIPAKKDQEEDKPILVHFPDVRKMFIPDPGKNIADIDLDRADAQVVAWESDDEELKRMFREGADIHLENAKTIFGNPRLTKDSRERKLAKAGVHATNYGASARTLARALGITVRQAENFQRRWFAAHPGIAEWHSSVEASLQSTRSVRNKFGFRRYYFDRVEGILPEALAWIPQSTVAIVINTGFYRIDQQLDEVDVLLQVHDSLVIQYPRHRREYLLPLVHELMLVEVPYDDPLIIPLGIKESESSWGECEDIEWPVNRHAIIGY